MNTFVMYLTKLDARRIRITERVTNSHKTFSVTWHTDGESQNETLILSIRLQNDEKHRQDIPVKCKLLVSVAVINWSSTSTQSGRSYEGSTTDRLYHEHAYIRVSGVLFAYEPVVK